MFIKFYWNRHTCVCTCTHPSATFAELNSASLSFHEIGRTAAPTPSSRLEDKWATENDMLKNSACLRLRWTHYKCCPFALVIFPTGGPSRDQRKVPREVSEVSLWHGSLGHLWRLPETAGGPPALNKPEWKETKGGITFVKSPFVPNQICKCSSSTHTKNPSRVLLYFLGSLSSAARPGCLSQRLWPQDAWAGHLNAGLASI